jgi:hypothetical protein
MQEVQGRSQKQKQKQHLGKRQRRQANVNMKVIQKPEHTVEVSLLKTYSLNKSLAGRSL